MFVQEVLKPVYIVLAFLIGAGNLFYPGAIIKLIQFYSIQKFIPSSTSYPVALNSCLIINIQNPTNP